MPQSFPAANPLDLLPNATFAGGITAAGAASLGLFQHERRFPYYGYNTLWDVSVSTSNVLKAHTVKIGILVEHATRPAQQRSAFNGTVSFNTDGAHVLNTNVGFANGLLGAVQSFQQADKRPIGHGRFVNSEFSGQLAHQPNLHHRRWRPFGAIDPFLANNRARNCNSVGRRPHSLNIHDSWLVPGLSLSRSLVLRGIVDNWQLSGVSSFLSGARGGFTYSYRPAPQGALTDNGSIGGGPNRPRIVCDSWLPRPQRTFEHQFRTECIAAPDDAYHLGTARGDEFQGPGTSTGISRCSNTLRWEGRSACSCGSS
jgi:hypothetical protein